MARQRMVRDDQDKLLYIPTRKGAQYMLFDVARDPAEAHDLAAERPGEVARLRQELLRWMLQDPRMEERGGLVVPREGVLARAQGRQAER
jgi:arylsulfatase A-like enzyme